ncbi:hypothetical protein EDB80DRAFT_101158 [Ilyonectria destructans]|nr:hypothetical protein EDB80DRAFT_693707 [Ilyonectria destructans]KAH6971345.1 hypothetical protein EDB80DRAFT_875492 [Ilyonectria destructans]KAH6971356.1 hypothetical protein EDB80DRAFT_383400 [Ilyonectria destructans]KAH7001733.1 hypothetical protein EDB80DRAFT_101158 [Ilyonectria destructans]
MLNLAVVYLLVSIALVVVAVLVHLHSTSLSLPISPVTSILVILLPIGAFFNALFHQRLLRSSSPSSNRLAKLTPFILQTLQALVTTILATLLFEDVVSSSTLDCKLDTTWMAMFRAHDATGIRGIQDTFDCCGLNSVRDRAYPFPGTTPSTCAKTYGRTLPCRGPWKSATKATAGGMVAVLAAVSLMQIIGILATKWGAPWWSFSLRRRQEQAENESTRGLLTAGLVEDEESTEQRENGSQSYGSVNGCRPRLEPSSMNAGNGWVSDEARNE